MSNFKKIKVKQVLIIKTQITLSGMSLYDKDHWKSVEKHTATLSTSWNDRLNLVQYLELLATLFR
ncbi:hypothetical protein EDC94DRAFT_591300 [Helicostylum pulchrum]|nr:hypothetical protein EDC94DRAFT_591300 [Helicostylum pulchrum]